MTHLERSPGHDDLDVDSRRDAAEAATPLTTGYAVLALDPEYFGSCPCATVEIDGERLELHCWRPCSRCQHVGIHYEGTAGRAVAERVKPLLDEMDWYGEWAIVEGFRRLNP